MQNIKNEDLINITGGAGLLENMGTAAGRLSNQWAHNTHGALGGSTIAGLPAAFAGLAGGIVGLVQGFGHTVTDKVPMP